MTLADASSYWDDAVRRDVFCGCLLTCSFFSIETLIESLLLGLTVAIGAVGDRPAPTAARMGVWACERARAREVCVHADKIMRRQARFKERLAPWKIEAWCTRRMLEYASKALSRIASQACGMVALDCVYEGVYEGVYKGVATMARPRQEWRGVSWTESNSQSPVRSAKPRGAQPLPSRCQEA